MQNWDKKDICFTWDDNSTRHFTVIAPLFEKYGFRCTFYINPNDEDLNESLANNYKDLYNRGFEVADHGLMHINMQCLNKKELADSIKESQRLFSKKIGVVPLTFAFPYHKYDNKLLNIIKEEFLETRNSLPNSTRYSLKSRTKAEDMANAFQNAINQNEILVVSGHSIITKKEKELELYQGYEPVIYEELELFLSKLSQNNSKVQTFYSIVKIDHNEQ